MDKLYTLNDLALISGFTTRTLRNDIASGTLDGEKIDGEVSDSLSLGWTYRKPHVRVYSVRPVYTVFNEKVLGDPVAATVEFTPQGTVISVH